MTNLVAPLPIDWYTGPDALSRERRALFADAWHMIGRADQLAARGSVPYTRRR